MDDRGPDEVIGALRLLVGKTPEPVVISEAGVLRAVTPAAAALLGFDSPAPMEGRPFVEFVFSEDLQRLVEYSRRLAEGGLVPPTYAARVAAADGSFRELELTPSTLHLGGRRFTHVVLRAVSRSPEVDAHRLYDAFFFRNTAVKLLIDPSDGRVVDANGAAERFYGWSLGVLRGMRLSQINTLPEPELLQRLRVAQEGRGRYFLSRHRVADGSEREVEVHTGPVEIGGRGLLMSIVVDLSDRRALEERLRQARKLEAVGRLAGGIAHDFNNLLTIVLGCGELLRPHLGERGLGHLDDLLGAAHRAGDLTHQLLAVGRRQQGVPRPLRLGELVRGAEPLVRRAIGPGCALALSIAEDPTVEADPGHLEQVLLNLALNAAESMDHQGKVRIEVGRSRDEAFGRAFAVLRVIDHGRGMDQATRSQAFEPFFTTKGERGTGLGLPSVHGIVSQGGGHVEVHSEPGHGTTMSVWWPCLDLANAAPADDLDRVHGALLWVVDDEPDLRDLLAEVLSGAGYRVATFDSAEAALAAPGLAEVAGLITDQVMAGRSGVELAEELRARRPQLPVLVVSGDPVFAASVGRGHDWSFLRKPFSSVDLARQVRALLG